MSTLRVVTDNLKKDIDYMRETLSQNSNPRCGNYMEDTELAAFRAENAMMRTHMRHLEKLHYELEFCCRKEAASNDCA